METERITKQKPWISTFITVALFLIPLVIPLLVFLSNLNTRVSIVEKTMVTEQVLDQRLRCIIREELRPILESHESRIRALEIETAKK